jgi:2,4-dienoyl-CoA reductase (NADPH2)
MLAGYDEIVIATGVRPRDPGIEGAGAAHVLSYIDVQRHNAPVGATVAVVGAGGIGFDVAEFLVQSGESPTENLDLWLREWGVADPARARAGLAPEGPHPPVAARQVTLLQRKAERPGRGLGKTTGWIHRASLAAHGVTMRGGVNYERITSEGLELSQGPAREAPELLAVDTVVLCAGQVSERGLADALIAAGRAVHVIGGADLATELDAKRAIDQGVRLAAKL